MVLMALVTTFMTSPLMRIVYRPEPVQDSDGEMEIAHVA